MTNGLISVIMGIYNCEGTLAEAVDSILAQTYTNWQLVMCDDCSTDGTYALAKSYADRFPDRIILVRNERNMRLSFSLNHCLEYAAGEYVARMDGDDVSVPERFEKELAFLAAHTELDLVGCAMRRFDAEGLHDVCYAVDKPDYYTLRRAIPYHHATILCHRRVYDTLGGYTVSERTMRGQDYDLWFRFYHAGFNGDNLKEALYLVREDAAAVRRRTFKVRWNGFLISCYGYKLLGYPKRWLIRPAIGMAVKSLTPYFVVDLYRKHQAKSSERKA